MTRGFACLRLVLALLIVGVPAPAVAEEPSREPEFRKHWYGAQTLAADGASAAVLGLGLMNVGGTPFMVAGVAGFALGAPIVHLVHRRPVEALASFALRVPAPLIVGAATAAVYCARDAGDTCGVAAIPPVATLVTLAVVVDAALLSTELVPEQPKARYASAKMHVWPMLSLTRRAAVVGVGLTL